MIVGQTRGRRGRRRIIRPAVTRSGSSTTTKMASFAVWSSIVAALVLGMISQTIIHDAEAVRTINMLQLAWLSDAGEPLNNQDVATSLLVVPLAVKHFNKRYDGIVPAVASARTCDVQISMMGGMRDDTGVSSTAMLQFVGGSNFRNVTVIQGPIRSDVSWINPRLSDDIEKNNTNFGLLTGCSTHRGHLRGASDPANLSLFHFGHSQ